MDEIIAVISVKFLSMILTPYGSLTSFNCEPLDGGGFRLRAGLIINGLIKRSPYYVFFTNGLTSLAETSEIERMRDDGIQGYLFTFTRKKNKKERTFWEVRCAQENSAVYDLTGHNQLRVSNTKPEGKEVMILSAVDGQYIYIS
ncbi:MAG: hypothetical protein V1860_03225 [bacterium]